MTTIDGAICYHREITTRTHHQLTSNENRSSVSLSFLRHLRFRLPISLPRRLLLPFPLHQPMYRAQTSRRLRRPPPILDLASAVRRQVTAIRGPRRHRLQPRSLRSRPTHHHHSSRQRTHRHHHSRRRIHPSHRHRWCLCPLRLLRQRTRHSCSKPFRLATEPTPCRRTRSTTRWNAPSLRSLRSR